jgi:hypothetical protein
MLLHHRPYVSVLVSLTFFLESPSVRVIIFYRVHRSSRLIYVALQDKSQSEIDCYSLCFNCVWTFLRIVFIMYLDRVVWIRPTKV